MKNKNFILGLVCLFFINCYMNYSQRFVYYPEPPDEIYDEMKAILMDLGYKITSGTKTPSGSIIYEDPYIIAKKGKHEAMITFRREQAETVIEIHISQVGEKVSTKFLEKQRDEIAQKFKERMKK